MSASVGVLSNRMRGARGQGRGNDRRKAWLALLLASTILGSALTPLQDAFAQAPGAAAVAPVAFSIPAQPLRSAIDAFIRQTGWQVGYPGAAARGLTSQPVRGTMTPAQALQTLVGGTGLTVRLTGSSTAALVDATAAASAGGSAAPAGAIALDTIDVSGGSLARGGVSEIDITPRELELKQPSDMRDVFAGHPAVKVGGSIPMSQKVYVHGVEETNLAVTIDGSRQNNKIFHHNGTTLMDPSFLRAARVDAGIAPADVGPGALAGAIAYETKDARDFLAGNGIGAFAKSAFNTNGRVFTNSLAGFGRSEGFDALGYVTFGKGQEYQDGNGRDVPGTSTDILSGLGKIAYEAPSGDRFQISHEHVRDDAPRPFRANMSFISGRPPWEPRIRNYEIRRQNTVFTYGDSTPTEWWDPKAVVAYSKTDVDTPIFEAPRGGSLLPVTYPGHGRTDSFNGKFENRFSFPLGTVTAGLDFYRDRALYKDPNFRASEKASNVGLYAQARLKPTDRTRLSFGLRGDRQWFTGTQGADWDNAGLSRNISGEFDIIPEILTAKAGYSHAWGGIQLAENFIMNSAWDYGRGIRPVTADNYTAGLIAKFHGFTLEGTVFRTILDNARAARFAVASATLTREVESEGYELAAGYTWEDGFVRAKYADIDVRIDGQPADSDAGTYLATPVGKVITLTGAHTFRDWGVTVGADVEIVLDYKKVAPGNLPLKSYEVVNAFVEYKPPSYSNLTFRAEVKNLLDQTYSDRATYGQEFGTVTPLYQPGRAFVLSASARF